MEFMPGIGSAYEKTIDDIDHIRRRNIAILVDEFGSLFALAKQLERSESQLSQWLNGSTHSATGKQRGMRIDTARYIEKRCNKPRCWLDSNHTQPKCAVIPNNPKIVRIAQYLSSWTDDRLESLISVLGVE